MSVVTVNEQKEPHNRVDLIIECAFGASTPKSDVMTLQVLAEIAERSKVSAIPCTMTIAALTPAQLIAAYRAITSDEVRLA